MLPDTFAGITRFEVIDDNGRALVRKVVKLDYSIQDEGRTLKVFVQGPPSLFSRARTRFVVSPTGVCNDLR